MRWMTFIGRVRPLLDRFSGRSFASLLLLGMALSLAGTWWLPLIDRDEPRFAEASREMLERQDWVTPTFNGLPRYDKPPLVYWGQMLCFRALGETPFAARLPSAAFATGTALLIFLWGRRLLSPQTALAGAVILLTGLQMAVQARMAVADMALVFFFAAACWSGWELTRLERPRPAHWWILFYGSLALGFLAKGPIAWLPLAGLLLGRWLHPQAFRLKAGSFALGMLLTLGIVGLWGIPALIQSHGDFMRVGLGYHVIYRSFAVLDGHGAGGLFGWILMLPYFPGLFFLSFFPWALRVPGALRRWWPLRRQDVLGWYLLTQAGLVFLVFTIARTKLPHYTLPAFPPLALWLAKMEGDGLLPHQKVSRNGTLMAVLILTVALTAGLVLRPLFVAHELMEKSRAQLQPAMQIAAVHYTEPDVVWEFRQVVTNYVAEIEMDRAVNFIQDNHPSILILPTWLYETNFTRWPANLTVVQARGMNWSRFQPAGLTALIHP